MLFMSKEFSQLVRAARLSKFASAREFFDKKKLSCSYFYYSKVEKDSVPELPLALEIIEKLEINLKDGVFCWVRDQMPNSELKALFAQIGGVTSLSSEQKSVERSVVVNRMQSKLLLSNPLYWEILVYLSSYHGFKNPSVKEISKEFHLKLFEVEKLMNNLYDHGLVDKTRESSDSYKAKEWVFIPYEQEFSGLRDHNFRRAFEQFCKVNESSKFRTTITALLRPAQRQDIEAKILALTNYIVDLSTHQDSREAIPYTVGVFSSPRKFGDG